MKRILGNHMQTFATALLTGMTLLLSQAAWAEIAAPAMADNTARIRLFGQNQRPSLAYVGIDCNTNPKGNKINVGGGLGDAFGSFTRTIKNTDLGMAATPASIPEPRPRWNWISGARASGSAYQKPPVSNRLEATGPFRVSRY